MSGARPRPALAGAQALAITRPAVLHAAGLDLATRPAMLRARLLGPAVALALAGPGLVAPALAGPPDEGPAPAGPDFTRPAPVTRPDRLGPAVDITLGGGLYTGEIGDDARRSSLLYRLGAGLSRGPWSLLISGHFYLLGDLSEPRTMTTVSYLGVGVEPSIRRELTAGHGLRVHMRAGYAWRWLRGEQDVQRLCDVHGGCDGGFWSETPTYAAHGPVLAVGLGVRLSGDIWPAFGVELAAGHFDLDRRGQDRDLQDNFISLGLNIAIGRAR